jgi:hypothetical protein
MIDFVRGVDPLISEGNSGLAQPLPSVPQIVRQFLRQSGFSRCPTVVLLTILDPPLAVIALSPGHTSNCKGDCPPRRGMNAESGIPTFCGVAERAVVIRTSSY